jgi:hypothetical protein
MTIRSFLNSVSVATDTASKRAQAITDTPPQYQTPANEASSIEDVFDKVMVLSARRTMETIAIASGVEAFARRPEARIYDPLPPPSNESEKDNESE